MTLDHFGLKGGRIVDQGLHGGKGLQLFLSNFRYLCSAWTDEWSHFSGRHRIGVDF